MSQAQVDYGTAAAPAEMISEVPATGQPKGPTTPQRTSVPASPSSDPGPPRSPDSRFVELLREENKQQTATIAEMMRRLDAPSWLGQHQPVLLAMRTLQHQRRIRGVALTNL